MVIEALVFIILCLIQLVIGIYGFLIRKNIQKTYAFILSSQIDAASTLENYSKIYRSVNINVNAKIDVPAVAKDEYILINKNRMYFFDLFTNYYVIYQLELAKNGHKFKRNLYLIQYFLFCFQFIIFALAVILNDSLNYYFAIGAIVAVSASLVFSLFAFLLYEFLLQDVHVIAYDLLDLDDIEKVRADALKNDLKFHVFEYPISLLIRFFRFFIPFK